MLATPISPVLFGGLVHALKQLFPHYGLVVCLFIVCLLFVCVCLPQDNFTMSIEEQSSLQILWLRGSKKWNKAYHGSLGFISSLIDKNKFEDTAWVRLNYLYEHVHVHYKHSIFIVEAIFEFVLNNWSEGELKMSSLRKLNNFAPWNNTDDFRVFNLFAPWSHSAKWQYTFIIAIAAVCLKYTFSVTWFWTKIQYPTHVHGPTSASSNGDTTPWSMLCKQTVC